MTQLSPTRPSFLACDLVATNRDPLNPLKAPMVGIDAYLRPFAVMEDEDKAERLQPYLVIRLPHDQAMLAYRAGRIDPIAAQAAA